MSEQLNFFEDVPNAGISSADLHGRSHLDKIRDCEACSEFSKQVHRSWARFKENYWQAKAKKTHIKGVWHG